MSFDYNPEEYLDALVNEWAYRVNNGTPNPHDFGHQMALRDILTEWDWNMPTINEFITNLKNTTPANEAIGKVYIQDKEAPAGAQVKTGPKGGKYYRGNTETGEPDNSDEEGESEDNSESKPEESDSLITGDPSEGDNQVKLDAFEYGYGDFEKETGSKPAPGGAGSMFNEIVSGEGVHMLSKNSSMKTDELAMEMYKKYHGTKLSKEQKKTPMPASQIPQPLRDKKDQASKAVREAKKSGDKKVMKAAIEEFAAAEQNIGYYTKCLVSARSAKKKYTNTISRVANLQKGGAFGKSKRVDTFYGANQSLAAQVASVENARSVLLPSGQKVSKDDAIVFVKAGGGGANPSDTATFVSDEKGNLLIQFHSDKTSTGDIQDNSTLAKEGDNYKDAIDAQGGLSREEKDNSKKIVDEYSTKMDEVEKNYNNQAVPIAQRLEELPFKDQMSIINNDKGSLGKNIEAALFGKTGLKPQYKKLVPAGVDPKKLSMELKYKMIRKLVASGAGKPSDVKAINKVGLGLQKKNPDIEGIDVKKNLSVQRKLAVKLQRDRINALNETVAEVDGVDVPLGRLMEAEETIRGFHLKLLDYPPKKYEEGNPGSMVGDSLDINMGGTVVNGDVLRQALGVQNTTEFKKQFRLEETDELTKDANNNITGKVVFVYAVKAGGEKIQIGYKTYRSKSGATGKTSNTMQYSKEMQKRFKEISDKEK